MSDLDALGGFRMDRTLIEVTTLENADYQAAYWRTRTPAERLAALEFLRQVSYGYDPATARLQRVITVLECGEG